MRGAFHFAGRKKINTQLEQIITTIHATPQKIVFEFAGAGSQALTWLHAVGGSSRTILEATDRYLAASRIFQGAEPLA
jgi:hypothetical protein